MAQAQAIAALSTVIGVLNMMIPLSITLSFVFFIIDGRHAVRAATDLCISSFTIATKSWHVNRYNIYLIINIKSPNNPEIHQYSPQIFYKRLYLNDLITYCCVFLIMYLIYSG